MSEDHHKVSHDYHLVNPSPWPFLSSIGAFILMLGTVLYMHPSTLGDDMEPTLASMGLGLLMPGLSIVLIIAFLWFRDVVREALQNDHTPVVQLGLRYGMILFIISEVFFFFAFFWAFFEARLFPKEFPYDLPGGVWPPEGIVTLDPFDLPLFNTLILLLSSCTVTWAHHALIENKRDEFIRGLSITVALGVLFTLTQAYEYAHAEFKFTDGIYASTFYMATGFHGFHVIVGTLFLTVCLFRAMRGHFTPTHHIGFESAAWYWHFVDIVWLFLFVNIYALGS